jgi:O-6-methylguanine DNA methyltransferase
MIRIADFPAILIKITRGRCSLHLPPSDAFFCSFDGLSLETQKQFLRFLIEYSERRPSSFPIPCGTSFQMRVWQKISEISFGETMTYGRLARTLDKAEGARAVGGACGRNPMPVFIPCHRVIAADGSYGGFAYDLEIKKRLLAFETKDIGINSEKGGGRKALHAPESITLLL